MSRRVQWFLIVLILLSSCRQEVPPNTDPISIVGSAIPEATPTPLPPGCSDQDLVHLKRYQSYLETILHFQEIKEYQVDTNRQLTKKDINSGKLYFTKLSKTELKQISHSCRKNITH